jgi:excisionase family DNA binding protein
MPKDQNEQLRFVNIKELAGLLGISEPTARRLVDGRAIPFYKFGGCLRFDVSDVRQYIKKSRVDSLV